MITQHQKYLTQNYSPFITHTSYNMYIIILFTYYDQCLQCLKQHIMSGVIQFISENTACVSSFIDQHLCTIL